MGPLLWLERKPQDLPYSAALCLMALGVAGIGIALQYQFIEVANRAPVWLLLVSIGFFSLLVSILLLVFGRAARVLQTLTALFGAMAVFEVFGVGLSVLRQAGLPDETSGYLELVLVFWSLVIDGHILRNALEVSLLVGCLLALSIMVPQLALVLTLRGAL